MSLVAQFGLHVSEKALRRRFVALCALTQAGGVVLHRGQATPHAQYGSSYFPPQRQGARALTLPGANAKEAMEPPTSPPTCPQLSIRGIIMPNSRFMTTTFFR
jgi:hypothetical protein